MIIDAHVHCGVQDPSPPQDFATIAALEGLAGVQAAVMTPPVMEVYDRRNPAFEDDGTWQARRRRANDYLLDLAGREVTPTVYPLVFIWNDFRVQELDRGYVGVKWHRHADEPPYHYDSPACEAMFDAIIARGLSMLVEEELRWTVYIVERVSPDVNVVIPHVGHLNGGFQAIAEAGLWGRPNVFTDLSGGRSVAEVQRYLDRFGAERLMFGSDYPFCTPVRSAEILADVRLTNADRRLVESETSRRCYGLA